MSPRVRGSDVRPGQCGTGTFGGEQNGIRHSSGENRMADTTTKTRRRWEGVDLIRAGADGGEAVRCCEHDDEPSVPIKRVEFLD